MKGQQGGKAVEPESCFLLLLQKRSGGDDVRDEDARSWRRGRGGGGGAWSSASQLHSYNKTVPSLLLLRKDRGGEGVSTYDAPGEVEESPCPAGSEATGGQAVLRRSWRIYESQGDLQK